MGVSVSPEFFKEEIAVAEMSLSKRAEFLCKYCNIKQNSSVAWLDYVVVDRAGEKSSWRISKTVTRWVVSIYRRQQTLQPQA